MFVLVTDCTCASHFRQHERVLKQTIRYNVASILRDDTGRQVPTSPTTNRKLVGTCTTLRTIEDYFVRWQVKNRPAREGNGFLQIAHRTSIVLQSRLNAFFSFACRTIVELLLIKGLVPIPNT